MPNKMMLLCVLVGMMLGAEALTEKELEEKIDGLDELKQSVEWLVKEFHYLKETKSNFSEVLEQKLNSVENLEKEVGDLSDSVDHLNQQATDSEAEITDIQNQLVYGGKNLPTNSHNSK